MLRFVKSFGLAFIAPCLLLAVSGCGYTTRSLIVDKYKTIYVENFTNKIDITREADAEMKYKIYKPNLEVDVTRAVINRFIFDGNLRIANTPADADLVLKGSLVEFRRDPVKYTNNDEIAEYLIDVRVNITMYDNKENKALWQLSDFTGETTYFTTGPYAISDDMAVNKAVTDLARRVVEHTIEQW